MSKPDWQYGRRYLDALESKAIDLENDADKMQALTDELRADAEDAWEIFYSADDAAREVELQRLDAIQALGGKND